MANTTNEAKQPAAPVHATAVTPPTTPPTGNKSLIIIAAIVGAIVVLALIAWAVYSAFFAVTKEDYRDAATAGNNVVAKASASYSDVTTIARISSYTTETTIKNNVDSAKKSLETYKQENKKLADLKALRDKDVKAAYDEYQAQYQAYVKFADAYVPAAEKALPAIAECEDLSSAGVSSVETFKSAVKPCEDAIDDVKDIEQEDLKKFIEAYETNIKTITALVEKGSALPSSDYTGRSALRTDIRKATTNLQDAQRDANSNIQKKLKDSSPRDAYNKFRDVLSDKLRE